MLSSQHYLHLVALNIENKIMLRCMMLSILLRLKIFVTDSDITAAERHQF
jgi:hypothetical protein